MDNEKNVYDEAATQAVELANQIADREPEADLWDVADGLLAGAVHYWLFSRQPCDDPMCEECEPAGNVEQRLDELLQLVEDFARESEYLHTENDQRIGRA
ncbi:MAG: hypothetical protein A2521_00515 [Deltaproteobacteria bacterium RIFOXYD12_FULL_57_12]|nr:MAG: hypothetical protein A2521_00515 [Deltaproteobacteria bacterium RIFOXYD12_FULL_57_12]